MKNIIALAVIMLVAVVTVACANKKQSEAAPKAQKCLVLYYSQTGTTKAVAEELQRLTGADIEAIEAENPYDGDFGATIQRVQKEREGNVLPSLKPVKAAVADYDVIYLGYPIWFGTYAPPIAALLKVQDFAGKKIVPFCTFGSGGLEVSVNDLKAALPKAEIAEGYGVRTARIAAMPEELDRFLKENGLVEGSVDALPEFSEQQPVTDAEKAIFTDACGNYQFPLGTPLVFCTRQTPKGTEYKFGVDNNTTIYVLVSTVGDEKKAEFTKVVR